MFVKSDNPRLTRTATCKPRWRMLERSHNQRHDYALVAWTHCHGNPSTSSDSTSAPSRRMLPNVFTQFALVQHVGAPEKGRTI